MPFVILTGASGVGKTSAADFIEKLRTDILVYQGDRIGLPPDEIMAGYGHTEEPGGPTQRGFALYWIGIIAEQLKSGQTILLETQCRIAFLREALSLNGIEGAWIVLLECSDETREARLSQRGHSELANEQMSDWSRFLHAEAKEFGLEIVDTSRLSVLACASHILNYFDQPL
jgi:chloramphenicol 3-O-phosphotransferase